MARKPIDFQHLVFFGDSLTDPELGTTPDGAGPKYASVLPDVLGVSSENFGRNGGQAVTDSNDTDAQKELNLNAQVDSFLAAHAHGVEPGTAVSLWFGGNDFDLNNPPANQEAAIALIGQIMESHAQAIGRLANAGVDKVILYNQFDLGALPVHTFLPPELVQAFDGLVGFFNGALQQMAAAQAAAGIDVSVIDTNRLLKEVQGDFDTFGFKSYDTPLYVINPATGETVSTGVGDLFGNDAVAFHDLSHPTEALHGVVAAYSDAVLTSDNVDLRGSANDTVTRAATHDLIFSGGGDDTVRAGAGQDVVFGGVGNDLIDGNLGDDLISGGGGNDRLDGGVGIDVLAGNAGNDILDGGLGDDLLIAGSGSDRVSGGIGNDVFLFAKSDTGADRDLFDGGVGIDTVRISVSDEFFRSAAFKAELAHFAQSKGNSAFSFDTLHLTMSGMERVEVTVDGNTVFTAGAAAPRVTTASTSLAHQADLWGLV